MAHKMELIATKMQIVEADGIIQADSGESLDYRPVGCHHAPVFKERVACADLGSIKVANRAARRHNEVLKLKKRRLLAG